MKTRVQLSILILVTTILSGCYYDVEEELYPESFNSCDTANVTYNQTVRPILDLNCMSCHSQLSQQGGIVLETYSNVISYVNSGQLLGAINHEQGFSPMPQGTAKLSDCNILKIEKWVQSGSPDN